MFLLFVPRIRISKRSDGYRHAANSLCVVHGRLGDTHWEKLTALMSSAPPPLVSPSLRRPPSCAVCLLLDGVEKQAACIRGRAAVGGSRRTIRRGRSSHGVQAAKHDAAVSHLLQAGPLTHKTSLLRWHIATAGERRGPRSWWGVLCARSSRSGSWRGRWRFGTGRTGRLSCSAW